MATERERLYRRYMRKYRREQGLCEDCGKPAVPAKRYCQKHRDKRLARKRKYNRQNRERMMLEGRCTRCGIPLGEEDEGCINCMNCREWRTV